MPHISNLAPRVAQQPDRRPIRQRLRDWAPDSPDLRIQQLIPDMSFYGKVTNSNTRPQSTGSSELDNFKTSLEGMAEVPDGAVGGDAELAIVGNNSRSPGDLVEMK